MENCHEIIEQLEEERMSLTKKIDRLELELKDERAIGNRANSKVTELQARLSQVRISFTAHYFTHKKFKLLKLSRVSRNFLYRFH